MAIWEQPRTLPLWRVTAFWLSYYDDGGVWPETTCINFYAKTMGFLFLGVKALSTLVATWTTVVLLGGFVSVLEEKDFWSLTAITLIQLPRAFNFLLTENLTAFWVPLRIACATLRRVLHSRRSRALKATIFVICAVKLLLIGIMWYPLLIFFILGVYISTGISLWRLTHHYYNNANEVANLKPALTALYSLTVAQGVLFGFRGLFDIVWRTRSVSVSVNRVKKAYKLDNADLVFAYLQEMKAECEKNPQFSDGKDMVRYAVQQLRKSDIPEWFIWEVRSVFSASFGTERELVLKRQLVEPEAFSHIIGKLLKMLHPRSLYRVRTRENAAGIVALLAYEIRLEQFPGGIQCISSLLDTSEEYPWLPERYHRDSSGLGLAEVSDQGDWLLEIQQRYDICIEYEVPQHFSVLLSAYKKLVLQGLCILGKLCDDEDNCRIISNTEGLMAKITAPLISSRLHRDYPAEWTSIAEETLSLMCRLMATPGETGAKLRRQISSNAKATINTLQSILECDGCLNKRALPGIAVEILLDLSVDTSSIMASTGPSTKFIEVLLHIFLQRYSSDELKLFQKLYSSIHWMKKRSYIRNLAGEKLVRLSSGSESIATIILQLCVSSSLLGELTNTLVGAKNNTHRMRAAEILEHLCTHYTNRDECLQSLKQAMLDAIPKVLREILGCGLTGASIQAETETNSARYLAPGDDLEEGRALPDRGLTHTFYSHQENGEQHEDNKLHEAFLSLCAMVCHKLISADPDLARRFDEIAAEICSEQGKPVTTFTSFVEEAQEILKRKNA